MTNEIKTNLELAPPCWQFYRQLATFFNADSSVSVGEMQQTGEGQFNVVIQVDTENKAAAMKQLLESEYNFAATKVVVTVLGPNENDLEAIEGTDLELLEILLTGNGRFCKTIKENAATGISMEYCVFTKELVQYINNDASSYVQYTTELAENVARKLFTATKVNFCTFVDGF